MRGLGGNLGAVAFSPSIETIGGFNVNSNVMSLAIAAGLIFAAWKFGDGNVKGMALGVAGVVVARQIPYVQDVLA